MLNKNHGIKWALSLNLRSHDYCTNCSMWVRTNPRNKVVLMDNLAPMQDLGLDLGLQPLEQILEIRTCIHDQPKTLISSNVYLSKILLLE